ncbi:MAG: alpha/beta family hydrolase [Pseudomonadota bacterium]
MTLNFPGMAPGLPALLQAGTGPRALAVLGHGAGAGMTHRHMQSIAAALDQVGIATLRFNFPFMEKGGGRVDPIPICVETFARALEAGQAHLPGLPCVVGGHSFGGRMSSHFSLLVQPDIRGLVYFSFPLHPAGKPSVARAAHLGDIELPQLFVSGDRDKLADLSLLRETVRSLKNARLHEIATADHSLAIRKRQRKTDEDVYSELARVVDDWLRATLAH